MSLAPFSHPPLVGNVQMVVQHESVTGVCATLAMAEVLALEVIATAPGTKLVLADESRCYCFDLGALGEVPATLRALLQGPTHKVGYQLKAAARQLLDHHGIELRNPVDLRTVAILVNGYLPEPHWKPKKDAPEYNVQSLVRQHLGRGLHLTDGGDPLQAAIERVSIYRPLYAKLYEAAAQQQVLAVWQLENDVIVPLARVERNGIGVDLERTHELLREHEAVEVPAREELHTYLGDIKPGDHKRVRAELSRRVGVELPSLKAFELEPYRSDPAVGAYLRFNHARLRTGLLRSFIESAAEGGGRVHGVFEAMKCPTGRMACHDLELQSVPSDLRCCFASAPGHVLIRADYDKLELRVAADYLDEPTMKDAIHNGVDLHCRTAAHLLGKQVEQVTTDERGRAKAANFGFLYGMHVSGFMTYARKEYGVVFTRSEAEQARAGFFSLYRGIANYHRWAEQQKGANPPARSASGRMRRWTYFDVPQFIHTPIASTAADGFMRALALADAELGRLGTSIIMLLHDEIIVETPEEHAAEVAAILERCMVAGMSRFVRSVPVEVKVKISKSWGA